MNRHERRKQQALNRKLKPLPPARQDGRPLYFDISPHEQVTCYQCYQNGLHDILYRGGEAFMADPANSPDGSQDLLFLCKHHLPEDAVIYNSATNICRNKAGDNTWMEDGYDKEAVNKVKRASGAKVDSPQ